MARNEKDHKLVFLPGFLGSSLVYKEPGDAREIEIWGESLRTLIRVSTFDFGRLVYNGNDGVSAGDVLEKFQRMPLYGPFLDRLQRRPFEFSVGKDLFVFPYDWRADILDSANALEQFMTARDRNDKREWVIIGHSMGALIARTALSQQIIGQNRVKLLIEICAPKLGSLKAFTLLTATEVVWSDMMPFILQFLGNDVFPFVRRLREAIISFPSVYQMMPHETEQVLRAAGAMSFDQNVYQWPGWNRYPSAMVENAKERQKAIHPLHRPPEIVSVYCKDFPTDHYAEYEPVENNYVVRVVNPLVPGDKTVIRESAEIDHDRFRELGSDHRNIMLDPDIITLLAEELGL